MRDRVIIKEAKVPFDKVAWGLTKVLIGKNKKAHSENVMIKITEYLPGYVHEKHVHPEQEEIIFVLSGKGQSETASGKLEFGAGDVVHIPAGVYHATHNPYSESLRAIIVKSPPDSD